MAAVAPDDLADLLADADNATTPSECIRVAAKLQSVLLDRPDLSERIAPALDRVDLRHHLHGVEMGIAQKLMVACRIFICVGIFVCTVPVLFCVALLLPLNPVLRRIGLNDMQMPTEVVQQQFFRWAALCLGLQVRVIGTEKLPCRPYLFMFSHGSMLDPIALGAISPVPLRFIGKRVLFMVPIIGWLFALYGHIPIDRQSRTDAIESLKAGARLMVRSGASIGIAPEGTRSLTGHLQSFKKGPFHMAIRTRMPVVPVIIEDAYQLLPPRRWLPRPGCVTVRALSPIAVSDQDTVEGLSRTVRQAILAALASPAHGKSNDRLYTFDEAIFTVLPLGLLCITGYLYLVRHWLLQQFI
ncbi:1-acyl-sn-glycerol-3-phosphate acyltransferase [Plasmodiophora brassicae]|nr:hypothetical protein PBRA_000393 [Plasmodiophora brassicae]